MTIVISLLIAIWICYGVLQIVIGIGQIIFGCLLMAAGVTIFVIASIRDFLLGGEGR